MQGGSVCSRSGRTEGRRRMREGGEKTAGASVRRRRPCLRRVKGRCGRLRRCQCSRTAMPLEQGTFRRPFVRWNEDGHEPKRCLASCSIKTLRHLPPSGGDRIPIHSPGKHSRHNKQQRPRQSFDPSRWISHPYRADIRCHPRASSSSPYDPDAAMSNTTNLLSSRICTRPPILVQQTHSRPGPHPANRPLPDPASQPATWDPIAIQSASNPLQALSIRRPAPPCAVQTSVEDRLTPHLALSLPPSF